MFHVFVIFSGGNMQDDLVKRINQVCNSISFLGEDIIGDEYS